MRRGTTPTHTFTLPFNVDLIEDVEITYHQSGKEILQKGTRDCVLNDKTVSVTLTQDDTFNFTDNINVEIQIRVQTNSGEVLASNIFRVSCEKCLSEEVL
jgi:hypothetical protein